MRKKQPVILQVLPRMNLNGGVEKGTLEIAEALQKEGITNYVVSNTGAGVALLQRKKIPHIALPVDTKNPIKMFFNALRLKRIIKDKKITLVHVRSRAPAWSVKWACHWAHVPYIGTFHGAYGIQPAIKKKYNKALLEGACVIAVSDFIKQHILDNYNIDPQKIIRIYRGADLNKFNPDAVQTFRITELFDAYQIPPEKPIICLPARLSRVKGHLVLLKALSLMRHKEVTCLFFGAEQGKDAFQKQLDACTKELSKKTTLISLKNGIDMPALYALSDIVVNARITPEAFGRTTCEAQAMGCLVVGSAHGGTCELIEDGKTGFLFPPEDAQALARVLDRLIQMPLHKRKEISAAAIRSVRKNFSIEKMCQKTIEVYKEFG